MSDVQGSATEPRPEVPYIEILGTHNDRRLHAHQKGTLDRIRLHEALDAVLDGLGAPGVSPVNFGGTIENTSFGMIEIEPFRRASASPAQAETPEN